MTSEPDEVREPISPELVLVASPEVARQARERLPEPSQRTRGRFLAEPAFVVAGGALALPIPAERPRRRRTWIAWFVALVVLVIAAFGVSFPFMSTTSVSAMEFSPMDGLGNNTEHPNWGQENRPYIRVAPSAYADGVAEIQGGPPARYISNRVFNDNGQNLFSENSVSQWGWVWGQFLDHTFGLRQEAPGGEKAPIPFDAKDPLERFTERPRRDRLHPHARRARKRAPPTAA